MEQNKKIMIKNFMNGYENLLTLPYSYLVAQD
jgi:hypothetical protein